MSIKDCVHECGGKCKAKILVLRGDELDEDPYELTDVITTTCEEAGDDLQEVEDALFYERLFTAELWAVEPEGILAWVATSADLRVWPSAGDYTLHGTPNTPGGEALRETTMALELERMRPTVIRPENL